MDRRELLGALGLGATGITGLVGARGGDAGQDTETARTTTTRSVDDGRTGLDSSADQPFATVWVGSREGVRNPDNNRPHAVRVWNDSEQSRTIGLRLVRGGEGGLAVLDRRFEFPADGYLTMRLLEPADYALAVEPDPAGESATTTTASTGEADATVEVPRSRFDCNDSWTDVTVTADGQVTATTVTTEIGCPPEVTERTFTAFGGSCASADEASVAFDAESVTVSGSIRAPDPCHGAQLAAVSAPSADVLRVTVATTEPTAGVCVRCVGTIEYRADLGFRDRVPGTVEVVHRRDDGAETVARATPGGATTTEAGTTTRSDAETVNRHDAETTTRERTD